MRFMILRKADPDTEAGVLPSEELLSAMGSYHEALAQAGVMRAGEGLQPSAKGVRVTKSGGKVSVIDGPFAETKELIAGFSMIDVATKEEAIAWVKRWPAQDGDVELEIRAMGCAGGLPGIGQTTLASDQPDPSAVDPSAADPSVTSPRFMILLKSNTLMEAEIAPPAQRLEAMAARNAQGVQAGVLLAGEGLQSSAKGARVKLTGGKPSVIDGPFTEIKELVAGYWLIQVASLDAAIDWVRHYPYPMDPAEVEIRRVYEASDFGEPFTPELREQEERLRAQASAPR